MKDTLITILVSAILGGAVIWWVKPAQVVEVPGEQTPIDSTAWVLRAALTARQVIIDSIEAENKAMAERIEQMGDQIASYTQINGQLRLEVDSLANDRWNTIPLVDNMLRRDSMAMVDTMFTHTQSFGDGLFQVNGIVRVQINPETGIRVQQQFGLEQLRDIRLSVVNTFNDDYTRSLVYVTSPDFEDLQYQSFTQLQPRRNPPWFWIGLGVGAAAILIIN